MLRRISFIFIWSILACFYSLAQSVVKQVIIIPDDSIHLKQEQELIIVPGFQTSSVVVRTQPGADFSGAVIVSGFNTFNLTRDEHIDLMDRLTSNLVIFPEPVDLFRFVPGNLRDTLEFFQIRADSARLDPDQGYSLNQDSRLNDQYGLKTKPAMIDQSVWRRGLAAPYYDRIVHDVHNLIIHHSATNNQVKDYTTAVRSIYLYHTQVNGWSDIGYNYIIAPNGAIYKGRDPGIYAQDDVMGAHFCSSNRGTMGICLLGTYTSTTPSQAALSSLYSLLAWKAAKDNLDPLSTYFHPLNPTLGVIAGHRDGCATLCPGDGIYSGLQEIRNRVRSILDIAGIDEQVVLYDQEEDNPLARLYPNPFTGTLWLDVRKEIDRITITDLYGRRLVDLAGHRTELNLENLAPGCYLIDITTPETRLRQRIVKL